MTPWQQLGAALEAMPEPPNVYTTPASQIVTPAVVIRPDTPWRVAERFGFELERYVAISCVTASDPGSGMAQLYRLQAAIREAADTVPGMATSEGLAPIVDESTGVPFLAATTRLTYRGGQSA